jgi:RES domain-containing protein
VLENLVHLPAAMRGTLPPRMALRIEVPDGAYAKVDKIPAGIVGEKLNVWCRKSGDAWLAQGQNLILKVPSIIVGQEHNFILNVSHAAMAKVRILEKQIFKFDSRLA